MPSPFPGMDPYLEISGDWRDFHARFIANSCDAIADQLPENYVARIDERFRVLELPHDRHEARCPGDLHRDPSPARLEARDFHRAPVAGQQGRARLLGLSEQAGRPDRPAGPPGRARFAREWTPAGDGRPLAGRRFLRL